MTSYRDGSWSQRFESLGDQAENVFRTVFPRHFRFGLERPDIAVSKLPLLIRSAPDFGDYEGLCEVCGFGTDQKVKLRTEKIRGLLQWEATHSVDIFLYDSKNRRWARGPMETFVDAMWQYGEYATFPEGKSYIALRARYVPFSWVKIETVNPRLDSVHVEGA